jgi:hypothetical protein
MHNYQYKALLDIAVEMNLSWDDRFHDPIGLLQLIDEEIAKERSSKYREAIDYFNSRL